MPGFGVSFAPGQDNAQQDPLGQKPAGVNPVQQAIQMLSLRLPRLGGAQGIAPGPLLQAPGSQGLPPAVLQALMQLAGLGGGGGMNPMGGPGGAPPPSFPTPRVVPGDDLKNPNQPGTPAPGIQMPPYAQRSPNVFGSQQVPVPPDAPNLDFTRPQMPGLRRMF